ncbi:MAG: RluA family pseudouridine synthase [Phycisphaerales bacterium]
MLADPALLAHIRIVRRSDRWVVIDKPAGVLSVPGRDEANRACTASWCREVFPAATGPITVHRLDMDTSGLLLMALDEQAQRELSQQFEDRRVRKRYIALVAGTVAGERGTIDVPMRADLARRPHQVIDRVQGRPAVTEWRVIERGPTTTRLELMPLTGRTHQLRVHCAFAGHPIIGDVLYSGGVGNAAVEPDPSGSREAPPPAHGQGLPNPPRLMLHASELTFFNPDGGTPVECRSPAPF